MKIKEVINLTGLSKKTVHYYIDEGLIHPKQLENGYYDFSRDDINALASVMRLKALGLQLADISVILKSPDIALYYLLREEKKIRWDIKYTQYQESLLRKVISGLEGNNDQARLNDLLTEAIPDENLREIRKPGQMDDVNIGDSDILDETDAEMLAFYFWGSFMEKEEMNEYQLFLLEKLKDNIVATQSEATRKLRDTIYRFTSDTAEANFGGADQELEYQKIADLTGDEIPEYVEHMYKSAKENLRNPRWVASWISEYDGYQHPCSVFFDGPCSRYMRELSRHFASYQDHINLCCRLFYKKIMSEKKENPEGASLYDLIEEKLGGYFDFEGCHSADLASLAEWK